MASHCIQEAGAKSCSQDEEVDAITAMTDVPSRAVIAPQYHQQQQEWDAFADAAVAGAAVAAQHRASDDRASARAASSFRRHESVRNDKLREGGGVVHVPGRILATLQRKFWDSNKVGIHSISVLVHSFFISTLII